MGGPAADLRVTVFPTCLVEYRWPEVGRALVDVYSQNGIACDIARVGCCGAPWLTAGDTRRFAAVAARNVATLANALRTGTDIVVAQPTCHAVITTDYADFADRVGDSDAELVATRTFDAVTYLADHSSAVIGSKLDTRITCEEPTRVVHHETCDQLHDETPSAARRLLERAGATVVEVRRSTGVDGRWGLRVANERIGLATARDLGAEIQRSGADVITGSCLLTNISIEEQTGQKAIHPFELIASTYDVGLAGVDVHPAVSEPVEVKAPETNRSLASHGSHRSKFLWRRRFGRF
jgi:glycerol-3-phosphate dehydrogenase subunit C